jgi:hypothetical protein
MSTYEPGTVAVATVRGVPNVRVLRSGGDRESFWIAPTRTCGDRYHADSEVTDIRPLVVLDLDAGEVAGLMGVLSWSADGMVQVHPALCRKVADQIEQQTKPPRIPEPGLWGVVEAGVREHDQRLRWVRLGDNYRPDDRDEYDRLWCDLIDPTLVRPGIEDGAS